jgi:hypothetical protein
MKGKVPILPISLSMEWWCLIIMLSVPSDSVLHLIYFTVSPLLEMGGIPYRIFFSFLYFIQVFVNIYYFHLSFHIFLRLQLSFAFKRYTSTSEFSFRALDMTINKQKI